MKSVLGVIIIILIFVMLTGCSDDVNDFLDTTHQTESNQSFSYSESSFDITNQFSSGAYLSVKTSQIDIPIEHRFMEGDNALGFDNVSLFGINGDMTVIYNNDKINSSTFCTKSYKDKLLLNQDMTLINNKIAEVFALEPNEYTLVCNDKEKDEFEAVFDGSGVLFVNYSTENFEIRIQVLSSNGEAVISVTQYLLQGE